ncbi:MAG: hypothetical protein WAW36_19015 [Methylovulum miyakonense]|uniref:hypothetical protein n=1 Tax=Methylovulum miyakonense TaxID=645578 RepID=UPI003BB4EFBE
MADQLPALPPYLVEYINGVGEIKGGELVTPDTTEPSWALVEKCFQIEAVARVIAGFELMKFKASLGHGGFVAALTERGIKKTTANDCMRVAAMFSQLNISNSRTSGVFDLEFSKLLKIQQWDIEEAQAFCEGESVRGLTLDDAKDMSTRDFEKHINEANALVFKLRKEIADRNRIILGKDAELEKARTLQAHTGQPPIVQDMRTTSTAITEQILGYLDMLEDMETTLAKGYGSGLAFEQEARTQQLRAALYPWAINLNAIRARLESIDTEARRHFAPELFPGKTDYAQLSEAECVAAMNQQAFLTDLVRKPKAPTPAKPKKRGKK